MIFGKLIPIIITGHSLGGAVALLDGLMLKMAFLSVEVNSVVFGLPTVGE